MQSNLISSQNITSLESSLFHIYRHQISSYQPISRSCGVKLLGWSLQSPLYLTIAIAMQHRLQPVSMRKSFSPALNSALSKGILAAKFLRIGFSYLNLWLWYLLFKSYRWKLFKLINVNLVAYQATIDKQRLISNDW